MKRACFIIAIVLSFICPHCLHAQNKEDTGLEGIISLPVKMAVPANAIKKGSIKAGNNATETHCDYEEVIAEAKEKAKAMGGNIVKITALIPPVFISKCYKIEADVYYCSNIDDSISRQTINDNMLPENGKDYVLLYIYRLTDTTMLAPSYTLHINDDKAQCFVKNKSRDSVKIYSEGPMTLWAKTMHRSELKLDTKFGEAYYIRCGVTGGEFNTTPAIERVDSKMGMAEYAKGEKRKKDIGVEYLKEVH